MEKYIERVTLLKDCINFNLNENTLAKLKEISEKTFQLIKTGGLILTCGNGGSYSIAEHFSAELNWRLDENRILGIPTICLGSEQSTFTAIVNDNHNQYERFCNLVLPFSKLDIPKVLFTFSTSLKSRAIINVSNLSTQYPNIADLTISFIGEDRDRMAKQVYRACNYIIPVESPDERGLPVEIIQEVHTIYMHLLSDMIHDEIIKLIQQESQRIWKE